MKKIIEKLKKVNKKKALSLLVTAMCVIILGIFGFDLTDNQVDELQNTVEQVVEKNISTYEMSEDEVKELPTTEIVEQTENDEEKVSQEQTVEDEGFELQGNIAYEGAKAETWNVELGDYKALTYYSQIDSRWSNKMYSSIGDSSQTIGTSGCGPTSASMVVTAIKGTITPDTMGDLFVEHGYRSSNNGTYFSAFRAVADEFDIGYQEAYRLDDAVNLLRNNNYVIVSCGNGLFTTGGHFIVIVGIEGDTLKIYDPYLYAGKFETSTRRGKVTVSGNTVYCSIDNFRNYANYTKFFAYIHDGNTPTNEQPVTVQSYTRYVHANGGLNVRNAPNGTRIGGLTNNTAVIVYETSGNWSHISQGWVYSDYLTSYVSSTSNPITSYSKSYSIGTYRVNASVLNVRYGASTKYATKKYYQLTANARSQNKSFGNYYTNGYKRGVVCTVTKISGNFGLTASGWICLDYCRKIK